MNVIEKARANALKMYQAGGSMGDSQVEAARQAFIQWLPTKIKELSNKTEDEVNNWVLEMSQNDPKTLEGLFTQFQKEMQSGQTQMAKNGAKLNAFVKKYGVPMHQAGSKIGGAFYANKPHGEKETVTLRDYKVGDEAPRMTRRQTREQAAKTNYQLYSRDNFRKAYREQKQFLRDMGLRGRDLRQAARNLVAGTMVVDDSTPVERGVIKENHQPVAIDITNTIRGPKSSGREGVISVGPLTEIAEQRPVEKPQTQTQQPVEWGPVINNRVRPDNWYQFQHEADKWMRANNGYRANQRSAEYQHWLWDEYQNYLRFPDQYIFGTPNEEALNRYTNAGEFTHGSLPWSRQEREMAGVDYDNDYFTPLGVFDRYRSGRAIDENNWPDELAEDLGEMILTPVLAANTPDLIDWGGSGNGASSAGTTASGAGNSGYGALQYVGNPSTGGQARAAVTGMRQVPGTNTWVTRQTPAQRQAARAVTRGTGPRYRSPITR